MPNREAWLKRRIEGIMMIVMRYQEELGGLKRELMQIQGRAVNDQADYGGGILPPRHRDYPPIHDPFVDEEEVGGGGG